MILLQLPPPNASRDAMALADWIEGQVPCYDHAQPVPWKTINQFLKILRRAHVSNDTILDVLNELSRRGLNFQRPLTMYKMRKQLPRLDMSKPPTPTIGNPTRSRKQMMLDTFAYYDEQLKAAILGNSPAEAEQVLEAIIDLLWAWIRAESKSRRPRMSTEMVKWEEINRAVNEAFARAQVSENHIRQITREEWEEMRRAPTPGSRRSVRIRLSRRVLRRNLARRNMRRRARR